MKIHFGHRVGKYKVLNYSVTFVPGSARCGVTTFFQIARIFIIFNIWWLDFYTTCIIG